MSTNHGISHNPSLVPPEQRKKLVFLNRGKDVIRIKYLHFQSNVYPRQWDTMGDAPTLKEGDIYSLPICGTGEVFVKWQTDQTQRADHFEVQFDSNGAPYMYIFGGDRWTMALRRAALKAVAENGNT